MDEGRQAQNSIPAVRSLLTTFVRLGGAGQAEAIPVDDSFWPRLSSGELGSFKGESLIAIHAFDTDWATWERHPAGEELVVLLSGKVTMVMASESGEQCLTLEEAGQFVLVPKGIWHTAKVDVASTLLFITPGEGTEHKPLATRGSP